MRPTGTETNSFDLPPLFRLVTLREVGDAFAHAKSHAAREGAGTLIYVGRFDLAEFAVVLEPEEPLREARRAFYVGMTALSESLASIAPPEKPLAITWPDAIRIDGGLVGGGRFGWPDDAKEDEVPDWLVFGATIRTVAMGDGDPGLRPLASTLEDEGFEEGGAQNLVESFARHLLLMTDAFERDGFTSVARTYLSRLEHDHGARRELGNNGDMRVRREGKEPEIRDLKTALATPSWLDPKTGGPRR